MPNVDRQHVAVIGQSGEAHAALVYGSRSGSPVDAVVRLGTARDYDSPTDHQWDYMVKPSIAGRANLTGPIPVVANPYAFFPLFEQLDKCRRYDLPIRDLGHNDVVSPGCSAHAFRVAVAGGPARQEAEGKFEAIRSGRAA